ncbi:uncharacterized protein TM35_000063790 [Trypanosoma theileri]|uniref:Uncharacterized protein n=1 Tax=Trypanosoma theileri TaxID=67003 RepID=A0A1X0P357_9TRYP|nr:uncharacterized protein TM35_000063790 [Trypanosoma theileri]ORC91374.1 hypothetical protein TM35_000063790 [Trypanosoma theileri]
MQKALRQRSLTERVENIVLSQSALPDSISTEKLKGILSSLEKKNTSTTSTMSFLEKQKCQPPLFGVNSICARTSSFLVSQGSPSHLRVLGSFVAAATHSELGKMLEWFANAVVGLFVDGVKSGVDFPQQWEESLQQQPVLAKHMFELQGFGVLFSYLLCQLAAVETTVRAGGLSGVYNNNNNNNKDNKDSRSRHGSHQQHHKNEKSRMERGPTDVHIKKEIKKTNTTDMDNGDNGIARRNGQQNSISKPPNKNTQILRSQVSSDSSSRVSRDTIPVAISQTSSKVPLKVESQKLEWESIEQGNSTETSKPPSLIPSTVPNERYKLDSGVNSFQSPSQYMYAGNQLTKVETHETPDWPQRRLSERVAVSNLYIRSIPLHLKEMEGENEDGGGATVGKIGSGCSNASSERRPQGTVSPLRSKERGGRGGGGGGGMNNNNVNNAPVVSNSGGESEVKSSRLSAFKPSPLRLEDIEQEMRSRELRKLYGVNTIVNYAQRELKEYGKKMEVLRSVLESGDAERDRK